MSDAALFDWPELALDEDTPPLCPDGSRWTERKLLDLLRARHHGDFGNGPAWAYMEHVRDDAGFDASRTLDALALHLWPSKRHVINGFEVKCSRSDWKRELAQPDKSAPWLKVCDYFWVVAPRYVVHIAELPARWGLLVPAGSLLRCARQAEHLRLVGDVQPLSRGLVAAMLRACAKTAQRAET